MKKLVTLLLTAALATAAATTAFADDYNITAGTDGNPTPTAKPEMQVSYTVNPSYTVTIPASVTLDSNTKSSTAKVSADNVTVPYNYAVKVTLTNANGFKVTSQEGAKLTYTVKQYEYTKTEGAVVLQVASGSGSDTLKFEITDKVVYSGTYKGNVIFTVSVDRVN